MTHFPLIDNSSVEDVQLAVVVLTYGASEKVNVLLEFLDAKSIAARHKLVVVHNPSRPNEELSLSVSDDISVIELAANRGYVGGMNAGIDMALRSDPEYVLLLTHDVRIRASDVQALQALMQDDAGIGAIGPLLCDPNGVPYSAGFVKRGRIGMRHRLLAAESPRPTWACEAIDGSAMMWRAVALREIRGFDERFFMYFDDVDICARAGRRDWKIAVATDIRASSAPGGTRRRSAHAYLRARNGLAYARTFGIVALLAGLADCALGLWRATPKPGGERFRDSEAKSAAAAYWRGTLLGVRDYFRGRWGPPPPSILRDGDIRATGV